MNKQNAVFTLLLMMGSIFSHSTMAKTPVANTPVDQSDYEPLHQGLLQLNVTLSTASCNLSINAKGLPLLTGCGAGSIFNDMNALNTMAKTPASLQFYDVHKKYFHPLYPVKLRNGDNPIQAPFKKNHNNIYRLEVSYE